MLVPFYYALIILEISREIPQKEKGRIRYPASHLESKTFKK